MAPKASRLAPLHLIIVVWALSALGSAPAVARRDTTPPQDSSSCGPGTICAEFDKHAVVFVGTVVQASPETYDRSIGPLRPQVVNFQVIEDFKGTTGGGVTLQFDPTVADGRLFSTGETVLVYASRAGASWFAGCTRTRRVTLQEPELVALRNLHALTPGGTIEGTLELPANSRPPAPALNVDLGNLPLTAQALDGSTTVSIVTSPAGTYVFPWLTPGTYRIRFDSPTFVPAVRDVVVADKSRCVTMPAISVRMR
jgi:hypothetical protein